MTGSLAPTPRPPAPGLTVQAPRHVGAILHALREVVGLLCDGDVAFGDPSFRPAQASLDHELAVAIGFSGDVDGWLALGMSRATAVALARGLATEDEAVYGVWSMDGLGEVGNVLAGACAMALHRRGFRLKLGDPVVAIDEPLTLPWPTPMVLDVPLDPAEGRIHVSIGMRVRGAIPPITPIRVESISLEF